MLDPTSILGCFDPFYDNIKYFSWYSHQDGPLVIDLIEPEKIQDFVYVD
jgi:hypothetical protein